MDRYKIVYRTGTKLMPGGGILRQESNGKIYLKSEIGVRRFCEELSPFCSIRITDDGKDTTENFRDSFLIVPSRYSAIRNR